MKPNLFDLTGRTAIITGGAGLLGEQHARAIAMAGGIPILADINRVRVKEVAESIAEDYGVGATWFEADVCQAIEVNDLLEEVLARYAGVDILINNVARNPSADFMGRFENLSLEQWETDFRVGLTSAFLCSQIIGSHMAGNGDGVIVNIASDLSVIAPDQRLYRQSDLDEDEQPTKPVSYSVVKHGLIGLTRYLAAYWAGKVRVNALSPGGVFNGQPVEFVKRISQLIPMGRMAKPTEMQGAIIYLCGDGSSYVTGQNLIVDGGRSII